MVSIKFYTENFLKSITFAFFVFGMWPEKNSTCFYLIFAWIFLTIFSFYFTFTMCSNLFMLSTMSEVTESLYMTLTELVLTIKILNFYTHYRDLQAILETVQSFELETEEEMNLVRKKFENIRRASIFYYVVALSAGSSADVSAFFSNQTELPFPAWMPLVNWKENAMHYWFVFSYQAMCMFITTTLNIGVEVFAYYLIFGVAIMMEVLGMRMAKIGSEGERKLLTTVYVYPVLIKQIKLHQYASE